MKRVALITTTIAAAGALAWMFAQAVSSLAVSLAGSA